MSTQAKTVLSSEQRDHIERATYAAAAVFRETGWTWTVRDGKAVDPFIPGVGDVRASITRKYEEVIARGEDVCISSGRLRVWRELDSGHVVYGIEMDLGCVFEEVGVGDEQ